MSLTPSCEGSVDYHGSGSLIMITRSSLSRKLIFRPVVDGLVDAGLIKPSTESDKVFKVLISVGLATS